MPETFTDTVRAFRLRREFDRAISALAANQTVPREDFTAIQNYVNALHEQMHIVNRAASSHTAVGSEYHDEPGSISGTLMAIQRVAEHAESNWEAFKSAKIALNKLIKERANERASEQG